ncbi:Fic/DOC family protein [Exiguobacterium artemiae]|uniref:Fic/DOC family protein n=1 Tax=Exiguobacterium artemiae TaxID=340145 RepID=UPI00047A1319|nr:Fic family protein [Exiguobacterium sibiricum]
MSTDPYSQDGVLKNKFGEKDPRKLEILEKRSTIRGWIKLQNELIATPNLKLDVSLIKKIHKNLFEDVYDWAGEYRTVNIVKGKTMFANALYVPAALEDLVTKLNRDITSKSITSNNIGEKLAYYYGELNMIHPFREGNGRTQRIFIEKVADKLGYSLQLEKVDSKKLLEVTIESVNGTGRPLKKVFEEVIVTKHFKSQSEKPHINSKSITSTNVTKNNYDLER